MDNRQMGMGESVVAGLLCWEIEEKVAGLLSRVVAGVRCQALVMALQAWVKEHAGVERGRRCSSSSGS